MLVREPFNSGPVIRRPSTLCNHLNHGRTHPLLLAASKQHHLTSFSRIRLKISRQCTICKARTYDFGEAGGRNFTTVPSSLLAAEREEAKALLSLFFRNLGLSNALAARTVNKSDCFIDHLISKLHIIHKSRYLVGRELTTLEIRNALAPYLESLLEEHGDILVDVVENFPNPPQIVERASPANSVTSTLVTCRKEISFPAHSITSTSVTSNKERSFPAHSIASTSISSKKERAIAKVCQRNPEGLLSPYVLYLIDLGMDLDQIKGIARRFPAFAYYSLDNKIKPVVEFLLELGVPRSDIATILHKRPQLCGISLSENLKPTMIFLEKLGVDKSQWAKVIHRLPALLTYSRHKLTASVDYFLELGVSEENIGKILTRCPHIVSYSVDENLRPTVEYFRSMGIDAASLIHRCPQNFGLSIEANLKPITEFFLEKGYSIEEIATMVTRYAALYTFSLTANLMPKWDYFLTMEYPRSELVKFPQYFGYSLEERIKPRYSLMRDCEVRLVLNQVLSTSDSEFQRVMQRKTGKLLFAAQEIK